MTARQGILQPPAVKAVADHGGVGVAATEAESPYAATAIPAAWPMRLETMATVTEAMPDAPSQAQA